MGARNLLQEALSRDKQCVRASIMLGAVEYDAGRYKQAIKALRRVRQQDAVYISESIGTLRACFRELGEERALRAYLMECLELHPSPPLLLATVEDLREAEGQDVAVRFLVEQLEKMPSLRGLEKLVSLQADSSDGDTRENLGLVQQLVQRLIEERPSYRCSHCGFAGRHLHWFCPGCKYWGTITPIRGTSME